MVNLIPIRGPDGKITLVSQQDPEGIRRVREGIDRMSAPIKLQLGSVAGEMQAEEADTIIE